MKKVLKVFKLFLLDVPAVLAVATVALPTIEIVNVIAGKQLIKVFVDDETSNNETEEEK